MLKIEVFVWFTVNCTKKTKKPQLIKDIKVFLNKRKKRNKSSNNMVMSITKIPQMMRKINSLSIGKNVLEWEKKLYNNYKIIYKILLPCKEKYEKLFSFALMFWRNVRDF